MQAHTGQFCVQRVQLCSDMCANAKLLLRKLFLQENTAVTLTTFWRHSDADITR